jgi:pimeloyl-ACP methyl ester carboxylesterase
MSPLSGAMFLPLLPHVVSGRVVVVPDRIGFGSSDPLAERLSIEQYAEATLDTLDALGIDRADFLGVHTGSSEAIEFATAHSDRVRRLAVVGLVVLNPEEEASFRARYVPPPAPAMDGSHLHWYWDWWTRLRLAGWDAWFIHDRVLEHVASSPLFWWTYHAVVDYPNAERIREVRQPFLVLAPGDHLHDQTLRAAELFPAQARLVHLPEIVCDEPFSFAASAIAEPLVAFLDG